MRIFLILFFLAHSCLSAWAQGSDSVKTVSGKGRMGMFTRRYFDIKNRGAGRRYEKAEDKSTSQLAFPFESKDYKLVFEDNFDSFNTAIWQKGQPWGRFHSQFPHQYYGDSEITVENGHLLLQNRYAPRKIREGDSVFQSTYGTGLINTYQSQNFVYGYFAIRSKNPRGPATWPAFWLTGRNAWPPEIDIFEMYGRCSGEDIHEQTMSMHFGQIENNTKSSLTKSVTLSPDTDTAFHIYSCLWEPGKVTFYTDGVLLKTIKLTAWMEQFYRQPMYIILNNAVDHRYLNCIKPSDLPNTFDVDWVRVYQKKI